MARSRNIKPGFFTNDQLAELPPLTRLLFIGLWTIADREGRLEDRPKKIKGEVLPYDNCETDEMLAQLHGANFITRYEVDGSKYIQINNFLKHQNPHVKEVASTIPAPGLSGARTRKARCKPGSSTGNSGTSTGNSGTSPADSLLLIPDSLLLIPDSLNLIPDSGFPTTEVSVGSGASHDRLPEELRTPSFTTCLNTWLAYKAERRESYKPTGLQQMLSLAANRAKQHGLPAVIAAMQKAMANGWKGWDQDGAFATSPPKETGTRLLTDEEIDELNRKARAAYEAR